MSQEEGQGQVEELYHPKDAVGAAIKAGGITSAAGLLVSAVQNTLQKQNVGVMGVFTRTGTTIATFAAMGAAFEFTKNAAANLRETDDSRNPTIGGAFAGSILGLRFRSAPAVVFYGATFAIAMGTFAFTGNALAGMREIRNEDEVARKERIRRTRRRPVEEVVQELGEGRGIYAPGYADRRAQRIMDNHGIDVTNPPPSVGPAGSKVV